MSNHAVDDTIAVNDLEQTEAYTLPDVSPLFRGPVHYVIGPEAVDRKVQGSADSARNMRSVRKAPGGRDAARQKDGG